MRERVEEYELKIGSSDSRVNAAAALSNEGCYAIDCFTESSVVDYRWDTYCVYFWKGKAFEAPD